MNHHLRSAVRVQPAFARRRYHAATKRWRITTTPHHAPRKVSTTAPAAPSIDSLALVTKANQPPLFVSLPDPGIRKLERAKRQAARKRRAQKRIAISKASRESKARGLQYRIKLEVFDRKIDFRTKSRPEAPGNDETFSEGVAGCRRLHFVVLLEALRTLREHLEIGSPNAGDVIAWIEYEGEDVPFAFDTCVKVAAELSVDPEHRAFTHDFETDTDFAGAEPQVLRQQLLKLVRKHRAYRIDYRTLLKCAILDADAGDAEAIVWITSPVTGEGTFHAAVTSLGFDNPDQVRKDLGYAVDAQRGQHAIQRLSLLLQDQAIPA